MVTIGMFSKYTKNVNIKKHNYIFTDYRNVRRNPGIVTYGTLQLSYLEQMYHVMSFFLDMMRKARFINVI